MKKILMVLLTVLLLFSFSCEKEDNSFKAGFVYIGSVNDGGWTTAHDDARLAIDQIEGIETAYVESVPEGADSESVIRSFAEKDFDVVFTTSYGFGKYTLKVADEYPDTIFMHCSGETRSKNTGTYFGRMYQAKYLAGLIAGSMTESNSIGFVAPHAIPEVIRHINAFTIGVKKVNPDASVKVVWTNSWFDPAKEKDAAIAMVESGCDVIATGADSTAPLLAAQEKGVWCIGYDSDASATVPESFLTAPVWHWAKIYEDVINKIKNEEVKDWSDINYWNGIETGIIGLAPMTDNIPQDVKNLVNAEIEIIKNEEIIFKGPLNKQDGSKVLTEGEIMNDNDIWNIMFFVEGVDGEIPQN